MTHYTKRLLISLAAVGTLAAGTVGIASAHMGIFSAGDDQFAQTLATKFNLNVADVKTFMTEQATAKASARLTAAVTAGKITAAQKDLIVAEQVKIAAQMAALKSITDPAARKTAMQKIQTDAQAWATANNIPKGFMMGFGQGMRRGFGGHR